MLKEFLQKYKNELDNGVPALEKIKEYLSTNNQQAELDSFVNKLKELSKQAIEFSHEGTKLTEQLQKEAAEPENQLPQVSNQALILEPAVAPTVTPAPLVLQHKQSHLEPTTNYVNGATNPAAGILTGMMSSASNNGQSLNLLANSDGVPLTAAEQQQSRNGVKASNPFKIPTPHDKLQLKPND